MKYFLNSTGQLFAFESDGSQDAYITEDMRPATDDEVRAIQNPPGTRIVPRAVTMRQARLALLQAGKLAAVNDAIASMQGTEGEAARIEWEFSSEVQRDKQLVKSLASILGFDDAQLDDMFILAATL